MGGTSAPVVGMFRRWHSGRYFSKGAEWNTKYLEKFINLGARIAVDKKDKKGHTPLDYARNHEDLKKYLLNIKKNKS